MTRPKNKNPAFRRLAIIALALIMLIGGLTMIVSNETKTSAFGKKAETLMGFERSKGTRAEEEIADQVFENPSFETGNWQGWEMGIPGDTCCCGSRVTTDPYGWWQYYGNVPDGNYCDAGPFDGCGPAEYTLAQDVTLPMGVTTVEFDWAYDIDNWGQPREMRVDVEPVGGGQPLERFVVQQIQGSQWSLGGRKKPDRTI